MKHNQIQKKMREEAEKKDAAMRNVFKSLQVGTFFVRVKMALRILIQYDLSKSQVKAFRKHNKAIKKAMRNVIRNEKRALKRHKQAEKK